MSNIISLRTDNQSQDEYLLMCQRGTWYYITNREWLAPSKIGRVCRLRLVTYATHNPNQIIVTCYAFVLISSHQASHRLVHLSNSHKSINMSGYVETIVAVCASYQPSTNHSFRVGWGPIAYATKAYPKKLEQWNSLIVSSYQHKHKHFIVNKIVSVMYSVCMPVAELC